MRIETLTGMILVVLGIVLILIGVAPRILETIPRLHPLIYTQITIGDLKIGTSPLIIIILTVLYLVLMMRSQL
ncbi:MAG: hypothetical protein QXO86_07215 [Nitrososphaerota archaeon]